MKIAIFNNFLDNIGGAEIVTLILAKELKADIYTTNIDYEKIKKMGFSNINIISLGKIPKMAPFKQQLAFYRFRKLNLKNKYDFYIISGDWAMSGAVNNKPNLWYIHSPLNELWEFKDYIRNNLLSWWKKPIYDIWILFNRYLNLKYLKSTEKLVCNSKNTQNRIKKYYNRNATIINPPIETSKHNYKPSKNYWLSVNRLSIAKQIEIQMKAFQKLPNENLIIVGSYEKGVKQFEDYKKYLQKIKPKNVEIKSWVTQEELLDLYANCKGFITTSKNEDFGMAPLEAMASGKPVIVPNEGGYKETVTPQTGILINNINPEKLIQSIKKINKTHLKYNKTCQNQAKKFDTKVFIKKIKREIKK